MFIEALDAVLQSCAPLGIDFLVLALVRAKLLGQPELLFHLLQSEVCEALQQIQLTELLVRFEPVRLDFGGVVEAAADLAAADFAE